MLAVQIHQQRAELGEHADRGRGAVHPGARLSLAQDFALQDEATVLELDAEGGEGWQQMAVHGGAELEGAFDDGLLGTRSHDIRGRALTEEKGQRVDDHGFAGAGLPREDVEARPKWQGDVGDDGEIADA